MNKRILGSLLLALLWMSRSFAQSPPPSDPQDVLMTLPADGRSISSPGDIWRKPDGNNALTGWTPTGGAVNLGSSSTTHQNLTFVNDRSEIYVREDTPFAPPVTAVDLATVAVDQIAFTAAKRRLFD